MDSYGRIFYLDKYTMVRIINKTRAPILFGQLGGGWNPIGPGDSVDFDMVNPFTGKVAYDNGEKDGNWKRTGMNNNGTYYIVRRARNTKLEIENEVNGRGRDKV